MSQRRHERETLRHAWVQFLTVFLGAPGEEEVRLLRQEAEQERGAGPSGAPQAAEPRRAA